MLPKGGGHRNAAMVCRIQLTGCCCFLVIVIVVILNISPEIVNCEDINLF